MNTNRSKEIDGNRLKTLIYQKGLTVTDVARGINRSDNYIRGCINKGRIGNFTSDVLEQKYGFKYDDYKPIDPAEKLVKETLEETKENKLCEIDYDKLYRTIYTATYNAMKMVLSE